MDKINRQSIVNHPFTGVLRHLDQPPQTLYVRGKLPKVRPPAVAIVGTRRPSAYGEEVTRLLATDLSRQGIVIISGLAFGVDAIAHRATLDAGGTTIAVQANGLHAIYPRSNDNLGKDITKRGGALLSEYPPGTEARRHYFLARNRLISGLADALIVIEATEKSGTLSTVAHALAQNKEVFAVPGPITSPTSAGPNRLIEQGAHPVLSAHTVTDVIAPELAPKPTQLPLGDTPLEARIIEQLNQAATTTDALQLHLETPSQELLQALTMMELKGTITSREGVWTLCQ